MEISVNPQQYSSHRVTVILTGQGQMLMGSLRSSCYQEHLWLVHGTMKLTQPHFTCETITWRRPRCLETVGAKGHGSVFPSFREQT